MDFLKSFPIRPPFLGKLFGRTVPPNNTLIGGTPDSEKLYLVPWKVLDFMNAGMQVCMSVSMQVCNHVSMQVCKNTIIQVCKYVSIQVCKFINIQVSKYAST